MRRDPHASQVRSGLSGLSAPCAPLFNSPALHTGRQWVGTSPSASAPGACFSLVMYAAMVNLVLFFYYWLGKSLTFPGHSFATRATPLPATRVTCQPVKVTKTPFA